MAVLYESAGYSLARLISLYGESRAIVIQCLREQGLAVRKSGQNPVPEPVEVTMARLYALDLSIERVGFLTGYTVHRTREKLRIAGVEIRGRGPRIKVRVNVVEMARWYLEDQRSIEWIADTVGVSYAMAWKMLRDHGVKLRPRGVPTGYSRPPSPAAQRDADIDIEEMARLYLEDLKSIEWLANWSGSSYYTARKMLLNHGVTLRSRGVQTGYSRSIRRVVAASRPGPPTGTTG